MAGQKASPGSLRDERGRGPALEPHGTREGRGGPRYPHVAELLEPSVHFLDAVLKGRLGAEDGRIFLPPRATRVTRVSLEARLGERTMAESFCPSSHESQEP